MNYFELFDIPEEYAIDQLNLQKKYLVLQAKYHPDKASTLNKREFLERSMQINEAFKILKDDYLRSNYLLSMKGQILDDSALKKILPPDELGKILEQYELIDEAGNINDLNQMQYVKEQECIQLIQFLASAFKANNITYALDLTVRLKYLTNLVENIKLKIKQLT